MAKLKPFVIPAKTRQHAVSHDTKIIVMSDIHRGDGTGSDDFAHNSLIFRCALDYYLNNDFTYIELGDAEELWENKTFDQIYITHTSIYDRLREFHNPDPEHTRYIKIWGNHDLRWKDNEPLLRRLFPGIHVYEAAILNAPSRVLLLHGHQFDPTCHGPGAPFSKFFVRNFWAYLQRCGLKDPTRAANNPGLSNEVDKRLYVWSKNNKEDIDLIIAGHTHRPVYENLSLTERRLNKYKIGTPGIGEKPGSDPSYFNTGSCVHPRCITGIEITFEDGEANFTLVKWAYDTSSDLESESSFSQQEYNLFIKRSVLEPK